MSEDLREDEVNLGVLCFIAHRAMEARVLQALAAAGYDDLTSAQGRVFARIGPQGTRVTDLAEQAQITKQTAGFLVDQLERAGYVRRVPDPTDARARLVQIAARGKAAVEVARVAEAETEAEWTRHLGKQSTNQLRRALTRLREITDPYR
ncbi:MarR family transcriptional regulator [Streptomyces ferrugineus]|uniref:MarR family transcriptional regulator n=1 Tax=Streptomyces ferrugineus TaxID=1413221 RepID=A0A7M2SCB3_9ACTN|nr:MarR family transcriptional regulator [Streptomyces ferrugineus]QOV33395.1 MarR family transcriptional regulator [Streptomyces ferrugineus]